MTGSSPDTSPKPAPAPSPSLAPQVFDRQTVSRHRSRAAASFENHSFLKTRVAEDLADRLETIPRKFARVLDLGCHTGDVSRAVLARPVLRERIGDIISCDLSPAFAARAGGLAVAADEEWLPFAPGSFDLVLSGLSLHWVNDLPGALIQIRTILKPDGLFLGAMLGGATLTELRASLIAAESELRGGAAARVSPFADLQDLSGLLQRAGFALPVADADEVTVRYGDPFRLLADLRGMGETHAPASSDAPALTRSILFRALSQYVERHSDDQGKCRATFEILTACGWAPSPDQPKPLRPGSAAARLADALGSVEHSAGDKVGGS